MVKIFVCEAMFLKKNPAIEYDIYLNSGIHSNGTKGNHRLSLKKENEDYILYKFFYFSQKTEIVLKSQDFDAILKRATALTSFFHAFEPCEFEKCEHEYPKMAYLCH